MGGICYAVLFDFEYKHVSGQLYSFFPSFKLIIETFSSFRLLSLWVFIFACVVSHSAVMDLQVRCNFTGLCSDLVVRKLLP